MVSAIKKGISDGYKLFCNFAPTESELHRKIPEYVLTVNIANELLLWNINQQRHLRIYLENSSRDFLNNAFPILRQEWDFKTIDSFKSFVRQFHIPLGAPSGRIDITLLHGNEIRMHSIAGVEVKAINPPIKKLNDDINRLYKTITATDPSGDNSITNCYVTFLKRLDKKKEILTDDLLNRKIRQCEEELRELIKPYRKDKNIDFTFEQFEVWKQTEEDYIDSNPGPDITQSDVEANTGVVMGVLISLNRK